MDGPQRRVRLKWMEGAYFFLRLHISILRAPAPSSDIGTSYSIVIFVLHYPLDCPAHRVVVARVCCEEGVLQKIAQLPFGEAPFINFGASPRPPLHQLRCPISALLKLLKIIKADGCLYYIFGSNQNVTVCCT